MKRALKKRYGRSTLPKGQRTYTIKISGGSHAGEYRGESTISATVYKAAREFVPYVDSHESVKVVHFDREGRHTHVDKIVKEAR
jgi:hypothetical protein